jgi:hypothetical protein
LKEEAREIVDSYFREARDRIVIGGVEPQVLSDVDAGMQHLLEISRKNSVAGTYRSRLKRLSLALAEIEKLALRAGTGAAQAELEPVDRLIIGTLTTLLPPAARSYEQAIRDLRVTTRLSWRGPATDLRESLRETLDHLAPDTAVLAEPGFKLEKDAIGPTMKQKVRFILRKRGLSRSAMQSSESATQAVDEIVGTFIRTVYTRSSVSTHTPTDRNEILRIRDWVRVALCELLEIRVGA